MSMQPLKDERDNDQKVVTLGPTWGLLISAFALAVASVQQYGPTALTTPW
jgi:hypothetical protein